LPSEAALSPHAAERVCREAAQKSFEEAARSLDRDWKTHPDGRRLDGKQVQRWAEALGRTLVRRRERECRGYREGRYPEGPANAPTLLVVGVDGGRYQSREKDPETGSRWREQKVLSVSSYLPGDGREGEGARKPTPLVTTHVASSRDAHAFGTMARVEAERRGYRSAEVVIGMGDGGNWIDPLFEREFKVHARVIDWCHAVEHLWDCAHALHGPQTPAAAREAECWEALLWDGKTERLIEELTGASAELGGPEASDPPGHPRRVLSQNIGYFTRHREHMRYPEYRAKGWPIGSGVTEAGVKQFNKRVKGTEQFWTEAGVEPILALRAQWISQDERWDRYWANRPAYVN
jgi:hypothetical protein